MNKIKQLDMQTANSIAAGEVVERPASVVKELVENALDAAASVIHIAISQGGIRQINVSDNGCGMNPQDAQLAFGRHTTSKLAKIEDLDLLTSMGFRGEALASIAAVAKVRLETREPGSEQGYFIKIDGGQKINSGLVGCAEGTSIAIEHLFFNVPARFKFLRKDATEAGVITDIIMRLALARPDVSFRLLNNNQEVLHTPGNNDLKSTLYALFGRQVTAAAIPVNYQQTPLQVGGVVGRPEIARSNRAQQIFIVNGRVIRSRILTAAMDEAYRTLLMKGRFAFAVLLIDLPGHLLDVNVHPQKMEVRFWNDQDVFRAIYHAARQALIDGAGLLTDDQEEQQTSQDDEKDESISSKSNGKTFTQQKINDSEPVPDNKNASDPVDVIPGIPPEQEKINQIYSLDKQPELPLAEQPRRHSEPLLKINALAEARFIGQLFNTYLLLELEQDFLLLDQHAAHEKILYEKLVGKQRERHQNGLPAAPAQNLLVPQTVSVTAREMQVLQSEGHLLRAAGFEFEPFGNNSVLIRGQPDDGGQELLTEKAFHLALDAILRDDLQSEEQINELYYSMACKAAVKAHDDLKEEEIARLIADLQTLENPYQCPHGRPVIVRISRTELEKKFKRIV